MIFSWLFFYSVFQWVIRLAMVPVVLRRRFDPAAAMAWLMVIFFLPELGLILYLLIGARRLGSRRSRLRRKVIRPVRRGRRLAETDAHSTAPEVDATLAPVIRQAQRIGGMSILGGNGIELLTDTGETIDRIIADIDAAVHHVHLLFYIFANDQTGRRVGDALIRAAERGVACRVMADGAGSRRFFGREGLAHKLRQRGVQVYPTLPVQLWRVMFKRIDLRNHRKIVIIDGRVAYTGSQNIVNDDYGHRRAGQWVDLTARFTGPVVCQLQIIFVEDWKADTGELLESDDILPRPTADGDVLAQVVATGPEQETESLPRVLLSAINAARTRVIITSPYFVPDEPTLLALEMAAGRDVRVDIVLPTRSDHRLVDAAGAAHFERLLKSGIRIHRFHAGMLHAKVISVDDDIALLGTSNLDIRSFYLNFEINVLLYGRAVTEQVRRVQMHYLNSATPLEAKQWRKRSQTRRYLHAAAALLSPLL